MSCSLPHPQLPTPYTQVSVQELMTNLLSKNPNYIRCVKVGHCFLLPPPPPTPHPLHTGISTGVDDQLIVQEPNYIRCVKVGHCVLLPPPPPTPHPYTQVSVQELMTNLLSKNPNYIRCVKVGHSVLLPPSLSDLTLIIMINGLFHSFH